MKSVKSILFVIILLLLLLPLFQQSFNLVNVKPLKGAFDLAEKPEFSWRKIFNDEYQTEFNNYIEDHIGFRPDLVRVNNQIAFSVYDTAVANWVLIGKENYLYELNYIRGYLGRDFLGKDSLNKLTQDIKCIQDSLEKYGVNLVLAFAPGKASYYPEFIPDRYNPDYKTLSNYEYYIQKCTELGINHIDFNSWFVSMKDTIEYPLVPKCGIHWSTYGVHLALDSLMGYLENLKNQQYADLVWDSLAITRKYRDADYDIAEGMNLIFKIDQGEMAYPLARVVKDSRDNKPNVIFIADSFYWNIFGSGYASRLFNNNSFWYYYQQAINPEYESDKMVENLDLRNELLGQDFVVILASETNLYRYGFGFFEDAIKVFNCQGKNDRVKEN